MSKIRAHSIPALESQLDPPPLSLSELYHENTKIHPLTAQDLEMIPSGDFSAADLQALSRAYKQYPYLPRVKLPAIEGIPQNGRTFDEVVSSRRSVRDFADLDLDLDELSKILHQSYGITGELPTKSGFRQDLRSAPSGGALYPAEIYIAVRKVSGVEPGIYHYNVPNHELELMIPGDPTEQIHKVCCEQEYVRQASIVVLISAVLERTKLKYGERGYRYALLDIGHLGQNIYLSCTSLELAIMTTCGFFDDEANKLLRIDGVDETAMYVAFIGKRRT
ncbi:MAG: SagB/ThcOx family dehydrogenase [Nitrospinaceae bacterium]